MEFYANATDLDHLENLLSETNSSFDRLSIALCQLVEDFNLVSFTLLNIQDKETMANLIRQVDKTSGYVFTLPEYVDQPLTNIVLPRDDMMDGLR